MCEPFAGEKQNLRLRCQKIELRHREYVQRIEKLAEVSRLWSDKWKDAGEDVKESQLPAVLQVEFRLPSDLIKATYNTVVKRTTCFGIPIVVKKMCRQPSQLKALRAEAQHSQQLRGHRHLVRLVGAYSTIHDEHAATFNILYFPVADCNLDDFLDDFEGTVTGEGKLRFQHVVTRPTEDVYERLIMRSSAGALPFSGSSNERIIATWEESDLQIQQFLRESMGCIAKAIQWMHAKRISHQDLKPANILLRNGQLYLTDFGITRDRNGKDSITEMVLGKTRGYCSPQLDAYESHHVWKDDIYALGCVFMHMVTVIWAEDSTEWGRKACGTHLVAPVAEREGRIQKYFERFDAPERELVKSLLRNDHVPRPSIELVIAKLHDLRNVDGKNYYGQCCITNDQSLQPGFPGRHRVLCKGCIAISPPVEVDGMEVEDAICDRCGCIRYRKRLYCIHCDTAIKGAECRLCGSRAICQSSDCGIQIPLGRCRRRCGAKRAYAKIVG